MKKLFVFLGLIICFSIQLYSQLKYDLEFYGSPLYSYREYKSLNYIDPNLNSNYRKGKDYFNNVFKKEVDNTNKPLISYLFGFKITTDITQKILLQTGLEYSKIGEIEDYGLRPIYKYVDINGNQVLTPTIENYHLIMKYTYHYISLPVFIRYKLVTFNKMNIFPTFGLSFEYLTNKNVDNSSKKNEISVTSKFDESNHIFRNFSSALYINIEFSYNISNKVQIYITPNFKQYYLPNELIRPTLYSGSDEYILDKINKYNYIFSLNTGVRLNNIFNR